MSAAADTQVVPTGTWKSDPVHSSVGFRVRHMGVLPFRGEAPSFEVTVTSDEEGVAIAGSLPVTEITTRDDKLTGHIASPDFFDAERHPTVELRSTSVGRGEDGEVVLDGDLTMRGVTKPVQLRGRVSDATEDPFGTTRVGLELEGVVDRREWGMTWQMPLPGGGIMLANEVTLSGALELVRQ